MSGIRGAWCKIHKASIKLKRKQAVFLIQNFCAKLQKKCILMTPSLKLHAKEIILMQS